jgi:hypothetical protein
MGEKLQRGLEPVPDQGLQIAALWQIDCECAREGCGRHSSIYTWWLGSAAASSIVSAAIEAEPIIACTLSHDLVLKREKMRAVILEY